MDNKGVQEIKVHLTNQMGGGGGLQTEGYKDRLKTFSSFYERPFFPRNLDIVERNKGNGFYMDSFKLFRRHISWFNSLAHRTAISSKKFYVEKWRLLS